MAVMSWVGAVGHYESVNPRPIMAYLLWSVAMDTAHMAPGQIRVITHPCDLRTGHLISLDDQTSISCMIFKILS